MAIILCPDCKKEMSDTAPVCPSCGYPYAKKNELYLKAKLLEKNCHTVSSYYGLGVLYESVIEFKDAAECYSRCKCAIQAEKERKNQQQQQIAMNVEKAKNEANAKQEAREIFVHKHKILLSLLAVLAVALFIVGGIIFQNVYTATREYNFEKMRVSFSSSYEMINILDYSEWHLKGSTINYLCFEDGVASEFGTEYRIAYNPTEGTITLSPSSEEGGRSIEYYFVYCPDSLSKGGYGRNSKYALVEPSEKYDTKSWLIAS